ncbi:sphingoid long-chain bases kinase 1-like isoform X1 [Typha latifolia]|uniref:sphingoid long-chain bases kinase 1-like isoform X1 n=1 Tax=Typha latifolia TaxID=4733 RepID=UPI003C3077B7
MQKYDHHNQNVTSPTGFFQQSVNLTSSRHSQTSTGQHSSPTVFPEKRSKGKSLDQNVADVTSKDLELRATEHKIDIGDEKSDLLGYDVFSGKLVYDKKTIITTSSDEQSGSGSGNKDSFDARLTSKNLIWGCHMLSLDDVISVSYSSALQQFTVHAYPVRKRSCGLLCFRKPQRIRNDFHFLASTSQEALMWVSGFADQQCFINFLPHPLMSSEMQTSDIIASEPPFDLSHIKCKTPPKILVILNPRSGHGRSSKVFHSKVEPIFKLAGFKMEVVNTTSAGHAKTIASTVDYSTCPDGIVCVGGDGIINEVLNGLLSRDDQKEAISIPIGIIPAGSDNSLVWTVLGVRDPVSAAMAIVRGGFTATDILAVRWIQTEIIHFGTTVSYFGFLSDVLELSEKYQKHFGPLRYFMAGFLRFLCLPKYSFELEYLPILKDVAGAEKKGLEEKEKAELPDYTDVTQRSREESIPRASSLSNIDSIMSPRRMSVEELDTTGSTLASNEPSEYVRGLDPKSKRLSLGRSNIISEPEEVLRPQPHLSSNPNWPRTRSKSRTDKAWTGLSAANDSRSSWAATSSHEKEDISSTVSDPGPFWDSGPKWDTEPKWDMDPTWESENPIELTRPQNEIELGKRELVPSLDEKWVVRKGRFLGILVCNHSCKTVQSLSSQVVAPMAEHDDNSLDLLLVGGSGRVKLLRFLVLLQFGRHLSLPFVEYVKVKSVKIRAGPNTHHGCGIDGEFLFVKGQVLCSLLPEQCRLIGRPVKDRL